jgi:hypothetical protein
MCPNDPPPDRPVFGNASAGDPLEIRYLTRYEKDRNDESGFVVAVRVTLAARAPAAYRAEVAGQLRALYPQAEVVVV